MGTNCKANREGFIIVSHSASREDFIIASHRASRESSIIVTHRANRKNIYNNILKNNNYHNNIFGIPSVQTGPNN